jgi:hypothetical protein
VAALVLAGVPVLAQGPVSQAPIASNPVVTLQGKITAVRLAPGFGMPAIDVQTGTANPVTVWLGSMRYLVQQKFNPSVGDVAEVRGYSIKNQRQEEEIVAITVKLPASNQELKLRDEKGFPVWAPGMGMRRGPGFGMGQGAAGTCPDCGHPCPHRGGSSQP